MSVSGVSSFQFGAQAAAAPGLSIAGGDDFAGKLQIGQIIKGRVLRHYEGRRYAVDFNGREKVVDSAVPLKTGELLYGKVIGLGEQVELERVWHHAQPQARDPVGTAQTKRWDAADSVSQAVVDLFAQHQLRLPPEQAASIVQAVRSAADQRLMAQAALFLTKAGIAVTPEWLKAVYETLRTDPQRGLFAPSGKALELQAVGSDAAANDFASESPVAELAALLKELVEDWPQQAAQESLQAPAQQVAADAGADSAAQDGGDRRDPGKWLMNVQTGGAVRHRVNTVPLLVDGQLLELNIAVFEQTDARPEQQATRHRQLSFSLHTERLGLVEAQLSLTGEHVKMRLASDREAGAESLSACSQDLLQQFSEDGWVVDAMHYEVAPAVPGSVARTVLQHVVSQDSVSRLV